MLASKDWKVVENFEKELTKCVKLDERVAKKLFDERWFARHFVKQGNAFHVTIKANEPLPMNAFQIPFYGITPSICKFNMATTIEKQKAQWEGKKVVHIAMVEPMWVHRSPPSSIPMERDCSKNCCKKFQHLVEVLVRGQQELAMRKTWVINKMQCIIKWD